MPARCRPIKETTVAWEFDESGKFGSEKAAEDYARRNGISEADFRTRRR